MPQVRRLSVASPDFVWCAGGTAHRAILHLAYICPDCFAWLPCLSQRTERYWYYSQHEKGRQYRRHCRRAVAHPEAPPSEHDSLEDMRQEEVEVLLDEDELAGV